MLKNYLTIAIRNLLRNKTYSAINIAGLSLGLASCLLITGIVIHELSYDRFHENKSSLYHLHMAYANEQDIERKDTLFPTTFAPVLVEELDEVVRASGFIKSGSFAVHDGMQYAGSVGQVNEDFLEMFTFPLLAGNPSTALADMHNIILSESYAGRVFSTTEDYSSFLGRTLTLEDQEEYIVSGILADPPNTSSIFFDFLIPLGEEPVFASNASWAGFATVYLQLQDGADIAALEESLAPLAEREFGTAYTNNLNSLSSRASFQERISFHLQSITRIYLDDEVSSNYISQGSAVSLYIGSVIALVILAIACFNFVMFSVGKSQSRVGEVGVRKVLGARRQQVAQQFWGEMLLQCTIALIVAFMLAELALPYVSAWIGKEISFIYFGSGNIWLGLAVIVILTSILAGAYPALYLSRFQPVAVMRHISPTAGRGSLSRVLIVLQNSICIILLVVALVISRQLEYVQTMDLGFDHERVLVFSMNDKNEVNRLKQSVLRLPGVVSAAGTDRAFNTGSWTMIMEYEDSAPVALRIIQIDPDYLGTMGIELFEGRNLSYDHPADVTQSVLVNETFVRSAGWDNPIGRKAIEGDNSLFDVSVVGVVKDFHIDRLSRGIEPLVLHMNPARGYGGNYLLVRLRPEDITGTISSLQAVWESDFPDRSFTFTFLDQRLENQYLTERIWRVIVSYAAGMAIFIASTGLLGLVAIAITRRTKEIGIRKVVGASVVQVVKLLSKEFLVLVLIANVIAWPIAWFVMSFWLQNFAYRIELGIGVFILAGLLALVIALATVSWQTVRAATANPVKALRYE